MAFTRIETYQDGVLISTQEVEVPDEEVIVEPVSDMQALLTRVEELETRLGILDTNSPTPEEIAVEEIKAVTTTSAKVNALQRYVERKAAQ